MKRFVEIAPFAMTPFVIFAVLYLIAPAFVEPLNRAWLGIAALTLWECAGIALYMKKDTMRKVILIPVFILPITIAVISGPLFITTVAHY